jgi:hypothetical protein
MLRTATYAEQRTRWPPEGRHILAQYDDTSIIVYQAYRPAIADHAVRNGRFGGDFSYFRMSWIKPNFLWMMYRCGWAIQAGQERVLAVRLPIPFFDWLLSRAVPSAYDATAFPDREDWSRGVKKSDVRLQWDPDHDPGGNKVARRAIQLGLRGEALRRYGLEEAIEVLDITPFVAEQRDRRHDPAALQTPVETVYLPRDDGVRRRIGLSS